MKRLVTLLSVAIVCVVSSRSVLAVPPAEQIFFATFNPSVLSGLHLDGATLVADDINPGSASTTIAAGLDLRSLAATDAFFLVGNQNQNLSATLVDRATGAELPRAPMTAQASREAVVSPDGDFGYLLGTNLAGFLTLSVLDLRRGSPTFNTEIGSAQIDAEFIGDVGATNGMAIHPQGGKIFVKVRHLSPDTIRLKTIDVSNPTAPAVAFDILAQDPSPGAPNNEQPGTRLRAFTSQGDPYLLAVRRTAQVYRINADGSLTYVQSLNSVNTTPGVNQARLVKDIVFKADPLGDKAFAVTVIQNTVARPHEVIAINMNRLGGAFNGTVLGAVTLDTVLNGQEGAEAIKVSADGASIYVMRASDPTRRGRIHALSSAGVLASSPTALLDTWTVGGPGNTASGMVLAAPVAPSALAPTISSVTVDGSADGVLVNDQARTLTVTGTHLNTVTHAFVGLTRASVVSTSATTLQISVPALVPANKSPVVVLGPDGSAASPVVISNRPTYQPSFVLFGSALSTNEITVLNTATKTEVVQRFSTGEGPVDTATTADGRFLLVADFRGTIARSLTVHSLLNDPTLGYSARQLIKTLDLGGIAQRVVANPVRPRAYVFTFSNTLSVIDTDPTSATFLTELSRLTGLPAVTNSNANARGLAISPDGRHVFMGRGENPFILVVNVESDALSLGAVTSVSLPDGPAVPSRSDALALSPDGTRLYFMTQFETAMRIFDISVPAAPVQIATVPVPGVVSGDNRRIQALPDGRFVYVSSRDKGAVDVFDPSLGAFVTTIFTGERSADPAVSPLSDYVFVAVGENDAVVTIDEREFVNGLPNPGLHTIVASTGAGIGLVAVSVSPGVATDSGFNVIVEPLPGVVLQFPHVTTPGSTTVTSGNTSVLPLPPHYDVDGVPVYFDVKTTADFTGPVTVTFPYDPTGLSPAEEAALRLLHEEQGVLVDRTAGSVDTFNNQISGTVESLGQFVVAGFGNVAPTAAAGPDRTVSAGPGGTANVLFDGSGSGDGDGDALSYSWAGPFGILTGPSVTGALPLGENIVTLTVTDPFGLFHTDSAKITVVDTTPPTISSATASPGILWPPNGQMVAVAVAVACTDNSTTTPLCRIKSVTSSEPVESGDFVITGPLTLNLRAKRLGTAPGRIYTITVECVDAAGNASTRTVTVLVPHDQR